MTKFNIGKAFGSLFRTAAQLVVPIAVGLVTQKVGQLGDKLLAKAAKPKV